MQTNPKYECLYQTKKVTYVTLIKHFTKGKIRSERRLFIL